MHINSGNISDFISYLFWKRKGEAPSQELLNSWHGLSDSEIQEHLQVLFHNWAYDAAAQEKEIEAFLLSTRPKNQMTEEVNPARKPLIFDPPHRPVSVPEPPGNEPASMKRKNPIVKIIAGILILVLALAGYLLFQYAHYKGLKYVYVLTDNVAVRNQDGKLIARMDVYGNPANNSYSFLRALDNKDYEIEVEGKKYDYRKVLLDSVSFLDYLLKRNENTSYVNTQYVTNNQNDFQSYREVFRNINNNQKENANLTSPYRNVLIGSLRQNEKLKDLYLENTCNSTNPSLSALIKYPIPKSSVLVVVAKLSDGQYYLFSGNNESQVYDPPRELFFKTPFSTEMKALKNQDFVFKQANGSYFMYKCDGTDTEYYAVMDGAGKIKYFKWSYDIN